MKHLAAALMSAVLLAPLAAQARDHGDGERGRPPERGYERSEPFRGYGRPEQRDYRPERPTFDDGARFAPPGRRRGYDRREIEPPAPVYEPPPRAGWRRGQILAPPYQTGVIGDYGRYHLRRPPPGYYWYRSGDDFVLAARASGMIFEVIPADGY